jgi:hypothetical protein
LTTTTPRTAATTKIPAPNALGYLDIGTKGYHLASILDSSSFCAAAPSMMFPLLLLGDVSSLVLLGFLSSLTVRDVSIVPDAINDSGDVRVYI